MRAFPRLRFTSLSAGAWVQSLIGDLRSHRLSGVAKKKKSAEAALAVYDTVVKGAMTAWSLRGEGRCRGILLWPGAALLGDSVGCSPKSNHRVTATEQRTSSGIPNSSERERSGNKEQRGRAEDECRVPGRTQPYRQHGERVEREQRAEGTSRR